MSRRFICEKCNRITDGWISTCPQCGGRQTYSKVQVTASERRKMIVTLAHYTPNPQDRITTGFAPWDVLVGGGMVPGTTIVLGGNKGFGKSTLVLQLASLVQEPSLIASAEEQVESIAQRAERTGVLARERKDAKVHIVHTNATEDLLSAIEEVDPKVIVIDSMNKFMSRRPDLGGTFGSGTQMKYLVDHVRDVCDKYKKVGIIIGQVRSDGNIAGPNMILHDVDAVFTVKRDPKDKSLRRFSALKNRLGNAEVVTLAKMTSLGFIDPGNGASYTSAMLEDGFDERRSIFDYEEEGEEVDSPLSSYEDEGTADDHRDNSEERSKLVAAAPAKVISIASRSTRK